MDWLLALEASAVGVWMRGSSWAYPFVNLVHVGGLIALVGSMLLLDLRLLGAGSGVIGLRAASDTLTPFAAVGLVLMLASGFLLFSADAVPLIQNPLFLPKLALIGLGILNALLFRKLWADLIHDERPAVAGAASVLPISARTQAAASLSIWVSAAILGRLLAYV